MKFLVLADIHGRLDYLSVIEAVIEDCEGIIIAGDITDFGGALQAHYVLSTLSVYGKPILAVPGNCDLEGVEQELRNYEANLQCGCLSCCGLQFIGIGGSLPSAGITLNESKEADLGRIFEKAAASAPSRGKFVLVTHHPAWGTKVDLGASGRHGGSMAVREFIERHQPILAVSGHIHDACGLDQLGMTVLVNPGSFREGYYALIEIDQNGIHVTFYP